MDSAPKPAAEPTKAEGPPRLRVLTVARWYPSHDSPGRGSFVADLVAATSAAGVDARVVSFDRVLVRGRLEDRDQVLLDARAAFERVATPDALFTTPSSRGAQGVPVARVPLVRRPGSGDAAALLEDHLVALRPFVRRLVAAWRPDVIHAHTGLPDGIVAADIGTELGIPVVVTEHMSTIEGELADPVALERYHSLLRTGVWLYAASPALATRVADHLGIASSRLGVLPNPVDARTFPLADPAGRDPGQLLWVGSLGEHKGIETLIRAFGLVRQHGRDVRLRLVGEERAVGDRQRWRDLASTLGVTDAVAFDGWLDRGQVAAALAGAGLFLHPSPSETFGVAAAEAILTGLHVASRQSGGVPWIIEESGGFGIVAADDSVEAFADAIERCLDRELTTDGPSARARLLEVVGADQVANLTIQRYREAIERQTPGDPSATGATPAPGVTSAPASSALPKLVLATERDHTWGLVNALPEDLRPRLTLVVPAPKPGASRDTGRPEMDFVESQPVPPPTRPPTGRSPITQIRRRLYKPAPTVDDLLRQALIGAARALQRQEARTQVVAIDAPAAALVAATDPAHIELAPGGLRWLADCWDADRWDADRWDAEHETRPDVDPPG